jgi:hypothetical protein
MFEQKEPLPHDYARPNLSNARGYNSAERDRRITSSRPAQAKKGR